MFGKPGEMSVDDVTEMDGSLTDSSLTVRLQAVGDSVTEDEVVCEIETDKVRDSKTFQLQQT